MPAKPGTNAHAQESNLLTLEPDSVVAQQQTTRSRVAANNPVSRLTAATTPIRCALTGIETVNRGSENLCRLRLRLPTFCSCLHLNRNSVRVVMQTCSRPLCQFLPALCRTPTSQILSLFPSRRWSCTHTASASPPSDFPNTISGGMRLRFYCRSSLPVIVLFTKFALSSMPSTFSSGVGEIRRSLRVPITS